MLCVYIWSCLATAAVSILKCKSKFDSSSKRGEAGPDSS